MAEAEQEKLTEPQLTAQTDKKGNLPESVLGESEPWEIWETKLCLWSLGIGIAALLVLGFLINQFLL